MDRRFRFFIILLMSLGVAAIWTFPSWYPLLNQDTVIERFPGLELDAQPLFAALPGSLQQAYLTLQRGEDETPGRPELALALVRARLLGSDAQAPEGAEVFDEAGLNIVRRGTWRSVDELRGAGGAITIYQRSDLTRFLRFDEAFTSTRAPGVHIIFTRNPDPTDERGVGVDYIDLGPLKGNVGPQLYEVPAGVDFSLYPILALYLVQYDNVISTATLR